MNSTNQIHPFIIRKKTKHQEKIQKGNKRKHSDFASHNADVNSQRNLIFNQSSEVLAPRYSNPYYPGFNHQLPFFFPNGANHFGSNKGPHDYGHFSPQESKIQVATAVEEIKTDFTKKINDIEKCVTQQTNIISQIFIELKELKGKGKNNNNQKTKSKEEEKKQEEEESEDNNDEDGEVHSVGTRGGGGRGRGGKIKRGVQRGKKKK